MSHQSDLISTDINAYLKQHEQKQLLRFITCGSVDDGKSTLIGRLLFDSKMLYEDELAKMEADSKTQGAAGGEFDPALATDGLKEEREQGITIDVAYRYFSTARRKFIIADTPGHEQYTRNMATGASSADLAVILIDARHGVMTQTKRHSFIVSLLGIRHVVVAINKMDLVDFSEEKYNEICADYKSFAVRLDLPDLHFIPLSALNGDNVVEPSPNTPWYRGSTLMNFLESVYIGSDRNLQDFRFPVQWVNRPNLDFRGFCGTIASGIIRQGDEVMIMPSRKTTKVKEIVTHDGNLEEAFASQSVTLTLADEVDCSRGDMIVRPGNVPQTADAIEAILVWMSASPMVPGKTYVVKHATQTVTGAIETLRYQIDVNTVHRTLSPQLNLNEIGRCRLSLNESICFDAYRNNRATGALILIDRLTNETVAAGMILDRSSSGKSQAIWEEDLAESTGEEDSSGQLSQVSSEEREARYGQKPATVLLTGLTCSGKTTIARAVERRLFDSGRSVSVLDGQQVRRGLSKDLGYSFEDRSENLRRAAYSAHLVNDSGLICIASFVAPNASVRDKVASVIGKERFLTIHVDAPIDVCRSRDTTGQYADADAGKLQDFPGVSAPYEAPEAADLTLNTDTQSIDACVDAVIDLLKQRGFIR
ncbi:Bifunctional enzyme CysN/CysC [Rosistilla oblonga]|uniref:Multifunctional fusion protein n=2 Tax=Rosistilla TaxID=2795779 RepID=A0A518IRV4_9BACT|nr:MULTISPECIES: sulfate adenylyltransferase subunit CysN [Rosistilla]QDS87497.1 Bifunctional enzyme CysN/CysC [Rosistilla ulvae]QDV11812.1 Bifunctional enzyme CysN/CysC [Rosistilla oblonga]QDV55828.1 Bifunctional enzyme CysN/CysC [Rosistilla oblonga]